MVTVDAPLPLSIIIDSPTSSAESWDSNSMHPSPLASHPFRIPTPSFTDLDIPSELQCASRLFSDFELSGTRTSYLGGDLHDTTIGFGDNMRRRRSRDDVAALIEFLRSNEPPASNFMAQPYSDKEEGERGKWDKLNVMGKRRSKSMSRALPPIRLPDSAVAGVTTGGHRHIAISIPLEASHFGDTPRSQYPVFNKDTQPPVPPLPELARTYKNDKGVVTVLRPLSPSHNASTIPASPASPRRFDRDYPPQLLRNRRMMPPSPPPSSSPPSSPSDTDHWPLAPTESEASVGQQTAAFYDTHEETQSRVAPRQNMEFVRAAYPSRGSSMAASPRIKHHHASSIDEVIAEEEPYSRNPSPMPREGLGHRSTDRRVGRPPVSLATSTLSRKSTSNLRSEWQAEQGTPARASKATQVTGSPVSDRGTSPSPPASILSVKSRREKVRDKKFRDLAAVRSSKTGSSSLTATKGSDPSNAPLAKDKSAPAVNNQTGPKLSTIMVVVDMNPDDEAADQVYGAPPLADDHGPVVELQPESAATTPPTPPASTETSPLQKHGFDTTRTSLTRRREWQTSREQERKKRESNAAAKMQLRQLSSSSPYEVVPITDPEREILYLYEAYREQRLRDMESRVRRLERNGDLWLRALHPMLEDVRSSSSAPHDDNIRDWASDDGAGAGAATSIDRLTRASQRRRLIRRASLSRERMLEEMVRREERDTLDHDGQHPDVSGMSAIEPLMRELAGGVGKGGGGGGGEQSERSALPRTRPRPAATRQVSGDVPPMPLRPRPVGSSARV